MKKYLLGGFLGAFAAILLLGAVGPGFIHNNWTTNDPPAPVVGNWNYSNSIATLNTNYFLVDSFGIKAVRPGGQPLWRLFGWVKGQPAVMFWGDSQSTLLTNGSAGINIIDPTVTPLVISGASGQGVDYLQVLDGAANVVAYMRSNVFWATTNDFFATLTTTDNTTNTILSIVPRDNSCLRLKVDTIGYNNGSSASYGKIATFRCTGGLVFQVGAIATLGSAEDDAAFETLIDTFGANTIRIRVAGNTAKTVNWTCYANTTYSQ